MNKKILLIENVAEDFFTARLAYCQYLVQRGWRVYALIPKEKASLILSDISGIKIVEYDFERKNKGLLQLLRLVYIHVKVIRKEKIGFVHSFRFQPNLINTLSSVFTGHFSVVHITGLGIVYSIENFKYRLLKILSNFVYLFEFIVSNKVIFQNEDDPKTLWFTSIIRKKSLIVLGSGIDTNIYQKNNFKTHKLSAELKLSEKSITFTLVSRLIWEKGIRELIEAFQLLKERNENLVLLIVGWSDIHNPRHVPVEYISSNEDQNIRYLGKRSDIFDLLSISDYFIYPSYYREGIPRSILEALAMSKPIITTDTPGCRLTVIDGENGILIEPKSSFAIKSAVEKIITMDYVYMSQKSRYLAENLFSTDVIYSQFENCYK